METKFNVGDRVWSQHFGYGRVTSADIGTGTPYVVEVKWEGEVPRYEYFTEDGQYDLDDPDPDCNIYPVTEEEQKTESTTSDVWLNHIKNYVLTQLEKHMANRREKEAEEVKDNMEEELKVGDWVWLNPNEKGIIIFIYPDKDACIVDSELDGEVETVMAGLTKVDYSPINPSHYQVAGIPEAIDIMKHLMTQEQFKGFLWGNIIKYAYRYGRKGDEHDTAGKIEWYANRLKEVCAEEKKEQERE